MKKIKDIILMLTVCLLFISIHNNAFSTPMDNNDQALIECTAYYYNIASCLENEEDLQGVHNDFSSKADSLYTIYLLSNGEQSAEHDFNNYVDKMAKEAKGTCDNVDILINTYHVTCETVVSTLATSLSENKKQEIISKEYSTVNEEIATKNYITDDETTDNFLIQMIPILILSVLSGIISYFIAKKKGYSSVGTKIMCFMPVLNYFIAIYFYVGLPDLILRTKLIALLPGQPGSICLNCNQSTSQNAKFCVNCGTKL